MNNVLGIQNTQSIKVPGEGSRTAQVVLVGEAPGEQEERLGRPFVGPSGRLLDSFLLDVGIPRREAYITNVLKFRPPNNNIEPFLKIDKKSVFESQEYLSAISYLKAEIESINPNIVLAVGSTALWALCHLKGIMKWRGSILESTLIPGLKVIPIIHPAAALREWEYEYFIRHDLLRVAEEKESKDIRLPQRNLIVNPTFEESLLWLTTNQPVNQDQILFYDIEIINLELACISFAIYPGEAISIPIRNYTAEQELEIMLQIGKLLESPDIKKGGQNLIFDATFLYRRYGIVTRNIEDTMIMAAALTPDFPKSLEFLTSIYTRERYYKDDFKMYTSMLISETTFYEYNARDSAVTAEVFYKLKADLLMQGNWDTYKKQVALILPLMFMGERGIRIDTEALSEIRQSTANAIAELKLRFAAIAGPDVNINSTKDLKAYFYVTKGIRPYVSTKKQNRGAITVDDTALSRIARRGYEAASIVREYRQANVLLTRYLDLNLGDDTRLRCAYNPVGTRQGRLSSAKTIFGEGTNQQNIPDDVRQFEIADGGCILYNIDLSQAENRIVAYIAPEIAMIEAFESGADIHARTASAIFGVPESAISNEPGSATIAGGKYSQRFWGKKANHSFNYGEGPEKFSLSCEIPIAEGRMIFNAYHRMYPGIKQYWYWVEREIEENGGRLKNPFGRIYTFMAPRGPDLYRQAYNFIPQSTVADIVNPTLIYIYETFATVELVKQVHDSIVIQMPMPTERTATEHTRILITIKNRLEQPITWRGTEFTIPCDIKAGYNLRDMKKLKWEELTEELLTIGKEKSE